jgi:winged helix-turn-helix protein/methyltransferase family protein
MVLDQERAEAFGERMLGVVNSAFITLLLSVGQRLGLFDAMSGLGPSTSDEVAGAAGCDERYVREWLNGLVSAGVIEYDPAGKSYSLPPEHAAFLTRAAGADNMAFQAQYVGLLADVEGDIIGAFREGGGVPYARFPRFQALMGEDSAAVVDANLLQTVLPSVPGLVDRLSAGIDVADVGCGQGHAINVMAAAFPGSRFTGLDISEEGIAAGRAEAEAGGLGNVAFEVIDAVQLPGNYDFITTFDSIHDQARPDLALSAIHDALRPHGTYLMVDVDASSSPEDNIGHPLGPYLYTFSLFHCMTVSLAVPGGMGLGAAWGTQLAQEMLDEAGFTNVDLQRIEGDFVNAYYVCTKGDH